MTVAFVPWQLTARDDLVHGIVSRLDSNRSVILIGGPGTGKTILANHVLGQLQDSTFAVLVRGTAAASDIPFGALSVLLSRLSPAILAHPVVMGECVTKLLADRAHGRRIVLFVDNIQDLDAASTGLIVQLAAQGTVLLLLACRSMGQAPEEISHLWRGGFLTRIEVGPFGLGEAVQVLREQLHAPISRSAAAELWSHSRGNPLCLNVLTHDQLSAGNLVRHRQGWVLAAPVAIQSRQTAEILMARLKKIAPGQLPVVELLALAGPLPLELLLKAAGSTDIASLEELGILALEYGPDHLASMRDPLLAEVVRATIAAGHSCDLREWLVGVMSDRSCPPANALAFTQWTLQCGSDVDPAVAATAARAANDAGDPALALSILNAVGVRSAGPALTTQRVRALIGQGAFAAAGLVVNRLLPTDRDVALDTWVELTLACVVLMRKAPAAESLALHALNAVRLRLDEELPAGPWAEEVPGLLDKIDRIEIETAVFQGRHAELLPTLEKLFHDRSATREFRYFIGSLLSKVLAVTGHEEDGLELARALLQVSRYDDVQFPEPAGTNLLGCLLLAGRWNECFQTIRNRSGSSTDAALVAGDEVLEGLLHALSGHVEQTLELLLPCLDQLRARNHQELLVLALALCAYAHSVVDELDTASQLLAEVRQIEATASWPVRQAVKYFVALASAPLTSQDAAANRLIRQADECRVHQATAFELFCLSAAVRLGHPASADRLAETAAAAQGPFARLCEVYGLGVAASDPSKLLQAARMAQSMGDDQWSRDAAESVLLCSGTDSNGELAKAARKLIYRGHAGAGSRGGRADFEKLTPRERQIAALASQGVSNKAIAGSLGLSPRTVEGHLCQIYTKLQLSGRSELEQGAG